MSSGAERVNGKLFKFLLGVRNPTFTLTDDVHVPRPTGGNHLGGHLRSDVHAALEALLGLPGLPFSQELLRLLTVAFSIPEKNNYDTSNKFIRKITWHKINSWI